MTVWKDGIMIQYIGVSCFGRRALRFVSVQFRRGVCRTRVLN